MTFSPAAPFHVQEQARIAELQRLAVLDTAEDAAYDDIVRAASAICGTPIALITLVDQHRQWFQARIGTQETETPREASFCAHAIQTPGQPFVVNDASKDGRFETNPLVTGDPHIRFYAGAPLVTSSGYALGTVCVIDTVPRQITPEQLEQLRFLAQQVITMLEARAEALESKP